MGYKAAIPIASGLAFVPAGATEPIVLHPSKGTVRGRPFVDYYNLRVVYHPNVYDWMPTPSWLAWLGKMPPKGTVLEFIRRPEHPLGNKYPYRAVAQQRRHVKQKPPRFDRVAGIEQAPRGRAHVGLAVGPHALKYGAARGVRVRQHRRDRRIARARVKLQRLLTRQRPRQLHD